MHIGRLTRAIGSAALALAMVGGAAAQSRAQGHDDHNGLDPFYTLHVWAWKDNPNGTFTNWNPNVSCDAFSEKSPQQ
jgi:hypothetical protein